MRGRSYRRGLTASKAVAWHERDSGARLERDKALVCSRYPGLTYGTGDTPRQIVLSGDIRYELACGVPTAASIRIVFPPSYPDQEPAAFDMGATFPHESDRHFYPGGQCCLWLPPESEWRSDDPSALLRYLDQVCLFFDRQFIYDALPDESRVWPGGERGHGIEGYLEYISDALGGDKDLFASLAPVLASRRRIGRNHPCPCGSGSKYKKCHLSRVEGDTTKHWPREAVPSIDVPTVGPKQNRSVCWVTPWVIALRQRAWPEASASKEDYQCGSCLCCCYYGLCIAQYPYSGPPLTGSDARFTWRR